MKTAKDLLGVNIRRLRESRQWTQAELAEEAGLSVQMIQKLEYGRTNPSTETLDTIARALGTQIHALFSPPEGPVPKPSPAQALAEAARMLSAMALASAPRRALILALLYRDESYLDELPHELAQAVRVIAKVP